MDCYDLNTTQSSGPTPGRGRARGGRERPIEGEKYRERAIEGEGDRERDREREIDREQEPQRQC